MISSIYRNVNNGPAKRAVCCTRKRAGSKARRPNDDAQFNPSTTKDFWASYSKKIDEKLRTRS